jgi:glutamate-1-semialdehyde aminotransferase
MIHTTNRASAIQNSHLTTKPGFHDALRQPTRAHEVAVIMGETHTIPTGPGGYIRAYGLDPDFFVVGCRGTSPASGHESSTSSCLGHGGMTAKSTTAATPCSRPSSICSC